MSGSRPRIVVLCSDGDYQRRLVHRLDSEYCVLGIVVQQERNPKGALGTRLWRYRNPVRVGRYLMARADLRRSVAAAAPVVAELFRPAFAAIGFPSGVDALMVEDVNEKDSEDFVERHRPDIVCVNGTNLLRGTMLARVSQAPFGAINLHTGLSPYTRGGNCNLYALMEGHPEWVGVTVHHLDPGIDSGDLIITDHVPMTPDDNIDVIDARAFHHGIELMVAAVRQLTEGHAARVPQWEQGRLYLRRTGFAYEPWHRYRVNKMLAQGLVRDYLADRQRRDAGIRLVGGTS